MQRQLLLQDFSIPSVGLSRLVGAVFASSPHSRSDPWFILTMAPGEIGVRLHRSNDLVQTSARAGWREICGSETRWPTVKTRMASNKQAHDRQPEPVERAATRATFSQLRLK